MSAGIPVSQLLNEIKSEVLGWINQAIASAVLNGVTVNIQPADLPTNLAYIDVSQLFTVYQSIYTYTTVNDNSDHAAAYITMAAVPSGNDSGSRTGAYIFGEMHPDSSTNLTLLMGAQLDAIHNGSGTITTAQAALGAVQNSHGGTIGAAIGVAAGVENNGAGTITQAYGVYVRPLVNGGGGTVSFATGVIINDITGATNNSNLIIGQSAGQTSDWSIFNSSAKGNYFAGTLRMDSEIILKEIATPASPAAGFLKLYAKSGDNLYYQNSAGTEIQIATGSGGLTSATDVQVYTATGTTVWNKPTGAKSTTVICIGGGAGGGSGRRDATSTTRAGGSGGGGGGWASISLPASVLASAENAIVGAGGAGGAAITANGTNGNPGIAGGDSSFGTWIKARGGVAGVAGGSGATGDVAGGTGMFSGGIGGQGHFNASNNAGTGSVYAAGGGGGGGGIDGSNNQFAGKAGGAGASTNGATVAAGTAGTVGGGAGGAGGAVTANSSWGGAGGGGGGGRATGGASGSGGAGGIYGGGGGGGAGSINGQSSGAGGAGADGIVIVITTL